MKLVKPMEINIVVSDEDKEVATKIAEQLHNQLVGNDDYINNNIVLSNKEMSDKLTEQLNAQSGESDNTLNAEKENKTYTVILEVFPECDFEKLPEGGVKIDLKSIS